MSCANCGKEFENGTAFCPYGGAAFCANCGVQLVQTQTVTMDIPNNKSQKPFAIIFSTMVDYWDDDYDNWKLEYEIGYKYEDGDFDISEYDFLMDDASNFDVSECVMVNLDINEISNGEIVYKHHVNLNVVEIDNSWYLWT